MFHRRRERPTLPIHPHRQAGYLEMPDQGHPYLRPRKLAAPALERFGIGLQYESVFEYYADDFAPFYEKKYEFLLDFNEELRRLVCDLLDMQPAVVYTEHYEPEVANDFRETIRPKHEGEDPAFRPEPYYQVFREKFGFLPNLSIADLLFNMGPEGLVTLRASITGSL